MDIVVAHEIFGTEIRDGNYIVPRLRRLLSQYTVFRNILRTIRFRFITYSYCFVLQSMCAETDSPIEMLCCIQWAPNIGWDFKTFLFIFCPDFNRWKWSLFDLLSAWEKRTTLNHNRQHRIWHEWIESEMHSTCRYITFGHFWDIPCLRLHIFTTTKLFSCQTHRKKKRQRTNEKRNGRRVSQHLQHIRSI